MAGFWLNSAGRSTRKLPESSPICHDSVPAWFLCLLTRKSANALQADFTAHLPRFCFIRYSTNGDPALASFMSRAVPALYATSFRRRVGAQLSLLRFGRLWRRFGPWRLLANLDKLF